MYLIFKPVVVSSVLVTTHTTGAIMKRWHEDYQVSYRQWKIHKNSHVQTNKDRSGYRIGLDPYAVDCPCDEQVGRFRKKDAWDCGKPHCQVCHFNKYPKREVTYQELVADLKLQEGINEFVEVKNEGSKKEKG